MSFKGLRRMETEPPNLIAGIVFVCPQIVTGHKATERAIRSICDRLCDALVTGWRLPAAETQTLLAVTGSNLRTSPSIRPAQAFHGDFIFTFSFQLGSTLAHSQPQLFPVAQYPPSSLACSSLSSRATPPLVKTHAR
ncbi:uncharacterized protein B0I36DRAFT_92788 [Microdochium trichocladiopsis]|uniref:Uncharacterized protein n=1 Tax=Microdochium trichocladiopsis TaxID=1682393 RepID=A0A9P8YCL5_9PEZI|nr:uncharacterized protein B0I36DRAFT_92788 [Microdochium trichocladiopsis]KAH7035450.1 hypothetical protein B0I36DRAFT_92788 [Microdochium trichocladiopsis]